MRIGLRNANASSNISNMNQIRGASAPALEPQTPDNCPSSRRRQPFDKALASRDVLIAGGLSSLSVKEIIEGVGA